MMETLPARCHYLSLVLIVAGPCMSSSAFAGGYALIGQSARSAGTGYAGASALAGGPDTVFYNPSGMAFLEDRVISISGDFLFPKSEFEDDGSTDILGSLRGGSEDDGATFGVVPSGYAVLPLGSDLLCGWDSR